jgi:hypothetical protein
MTVKDKALSTVKATLFRFLGRRLACFPSSPRLLDLQRCTRTDILRAVKRAQANHPGAKIFVLSEDARADSSIKGVITIDDWELLQRETGTCAVILACNSDELALKAIHFIQSRKSMFYYGADRVAPIARYFHRNEIARRVLKEAFGVGFDKFDLLDFENIIQAIDATSSIAGDYVEIGVYKGASAYVALDYMERANLPRRSFFLDTFSGFDYPQAAVSADRTWQNTHGEASYEGAKKLLSRFRVPHEVIAANIVTDPLPEVIKSISVCNIDVDMYEAVAAALAKVAPLVGQGGIIIAEDQGHTPLLLGAYAAVTEFLRSKEGGAFVPIQLSSGQMFMVKSRP